MILLYCCCDSKYFVLFEHYSRSLKNGDIISVDVSVSVNEVNNHFKLYVCCKISRKRTVIKKWLPFLFQAQ